MKITVMIIILLKQSCLSCPVMGELTVQGLDSSLRPPGPDFSLILVEGY